MTEMPSVGSYAAAQVHQSVFAKISETDADLLEGTLNNTLMKADAALNSPTAPEELLPVFQFKSGAVVDIASFLSSVRAAIELGMDVSESQVRELTGLRPPGPTETGLLQFHQQQQQLGLGGNGTGNEVDGEDPQALIEAIRSRAVKKTTAKAKAKDNDHSKDDSED
jgi:phage gp29-like protein